MLGPFVEEPLHVSDSFLDATDFAFDLIEREDPHAVEIVRVREDERESVWSYSREASERYRDATGSRGADRCCDQQGASIVKTIGATGAASEREPGGSASFAPSY